MCRAASNKPLYILPFATIAQQYMLSSAPTSPIAMLIVMSLLISTSANAILGRN
jgi:hypothetical protein